MSAGDESRAIERGASPCEHVLSLALCLAILTFSIELWEADLRVPFAYEGDGLFTLMLVKSGLDAGSYFENPMLGAPSQLEMYDRPVGAGLHFAGLTVLSAIFGSAPVVVNLYFLIGFPLTTATSLSVLRRLGLGGAASVVMALLFTFLPYHLMRGPGHLFLASYFMVPPTVLVARWVSDGLAISWPLDRRAAIALAIMAFLASTGIYYAFFGGVLIAAHGVLAALRRRMRRPLATAGLLGATLFIVSAANMAPNLVHMAQHGRSADAVVRTRSAADLYALKPATLLVPVPDHRLPLLRTARHLYDRGMPQDETSTASLGLFGSVGFLACVAFLFGRRPERLLAFLTESNLVLLALGTTGGAGALIASFVTPLVRAYTRVSVVIGFLSLVAFALLVERAIGLLAARRPSLKLVRALWPGVLVLGVLDQTSPSLLPRYEKQRAAFDSDRFFGQALERAVGSRATVFVLPHLAFPEETGTISPSELFRGYLHTKSVRYATGALGGSYAATWQRRMAEKPPAALIQALTLARFAGIYVDRRGMPPGAELERALAKDLGKPLESPDGRMAFYRLSLDRRSSTVAGHTPAGPDLVVESFSGFYEEERRGAERWRWCSGRGTITFTNPAAHTQKVRVSFAVHPATEGPLMLSLDGLLTEQLDIPWPRTRLERVIDVPAGASKLEFSATGETRVPPGDGRTLSFAVEGFSIGPA